MSDNIIDLGSSLLKFKNDLAEREKIINQQQLQIQDLQRQLASVSAVNDMLKLLMMDMISLSKGKIDQDTEHLRQLQELFQKLPHINHPQ
jgi:hypothetical protein